MASDLLTKKKFSFTSKATTADSFAVVSFTGSEAISQPYEFEIVLVSEKTDIDPLQVLHHSAVFTIHRDKEQDVQFNGIVMQFEETQEFNGYLFFKAVLAPKLRWLALTHHNQVFLDLTIPEIMREALKDAELSEGIDFEFRLQNEYQPIEYVCQYDESHLNFVSRWAEREGIYYFFEQTSQGEKAVFTDTKIAQTDLILGKDLIYMPQTGLDSLHTKEVIKDFVCKHTLLPERVYLKDYNYRKPSLAMEGIADVDLGGRGENYIYGEHFFTPEEGNRLAKIRADELLCRKSVFLGGSSVPFMVPGFTFDLQEHYRSIYNRKYLITDVIHEGHQTGYLISGLGPALTPREEQMFYANSFTAIYSDVQFRPVRAATKPKISGTINAKIDAAASGQYAELDEQGRYKVILPFDRSGRHNGKASAWFRMMQPYAGTNQGMHFPLHKGTEVVLTFIDGDPDRPLIAGAVPNPNTSSPVNVANQTKSVITTGRNATDQSAGAAEYVETGDSGSSSDTNYIEFDDASGSEGIRIHSTGDLWTEAQGRYADYTIEGPSTASDVPSELQYLWKKFYDIASPAFNPTGMQLYDYVLHSGGEVNSGSTATAASTSSLSGLARFGKIQLKKGDTFNTQDGNIYDFGGYWNYNLGNSYEENYMSQDDSVTLNSSSLPKDKTDKGGPDYTSIDGLPNGNGSHIETAQNGDVITSVWVSKTIKGASYEYKTQHDSLEVNHKCYSTEYKYGGRVEEYVYDGTTGYKASKMTSEGGHTQEWKYDRKTKDVQLSYESTRWDGNTIRTAASFNANRTSSSVSLARQASAEVNLADAVSAEFSLSRKFSTSLNLGMSFSLDFSAAAGMKIDLGASMIMEIKGHLGGTLSYNTVTQEFSGGFPGIKAQKEAAIKARLAELELESLKLRVPEHKITLANKLVDIKKIEVSIEPITSCKLVT